MKKENIYQKKMLTLRIESGQNWVYKNRKHLGLPYLSMKNYADTAAEVSRKQTKIIRALANADSALGVASVRKKRK